MTNVTAEKLQRYYLESRGLLRPVVALAKGCVSGLRIDVRTVLRTPPVYWDVLPIPTNDLFDPRIPHRSSQASSSLWRFLGLAGCWPGVCEDVGMPAPLVWVCPMLPWDRMEGVLRLKSYQGYLLSVC